MFLQIDGYVPSVSTAQDMRSGGGAYPFQSSAVALEIVSASANDTAAGTGARTVAIRGLGADYVTVDQVAVLNGTTPVALSTPLMRVNDARVVTAGSGGENAGNLTIRLAAAGVSQGIILATRNRMQQTIYTVPAHRIFQITDVAYSVVSAVSQNTIAVFRRKVRAPGGVFYPGLEQSISDVASLIVNLVSPIYVPEKTDIRYLATATSVSTLAVTLRGNLIELPS